MSSNLKIKRICAWCGKEFIAQKTTTACCSKQCANALYKKKKRDEAIKANNQFVEKKIDEKPIERIKDKPFLTITETAIYLGVTRPTVYRYIKRGELKVTRLGFKYLLKKEDIDELFNNPTEFHTPTKEKAPNPDITDWYSSQEMQDKFGMTLSAIYTFVSKNAIPKKKEGIMVYYSKKHVDIAKGVTAPEEPQYYTVAEAMEKFNLTRDQLYHYAKYHNIPKVKKGKYTLISKTELDKLLEAPKIE